MMAPKDPLVAPTFDEESSARLVNARLGLTANPRLEAIMTALVPHLHAAIKETALTPAELRTGLAFLAEAGQSKGATAGELTLLSELLGASALVDSLHVEEDAASLLRSFYRANAPHYPLGADIYLERRTSICVAYLRPVLWANIRFARQSPGTRRFRQTGPSASSLRRVAATFIAPRASTSSSARRATRGS